jgi:hypothetical protein
MICPNCGDENSVEIPVVDIGVGNIQCAPAFCHACHWEEPPPPMVELLDEEDAK